MKCQKEHMLLYAVTDRAWVGEKTLFEQCKDALEGGVTCLQLREKELPYEAFLKEAIELKALCDQYAVPFIVNDNVDIAVASRAHGIHVGQSDMAAGDVRTKIGPDMILGVSAQTVEQALAAEKAGADYLGVGAVFPTGTKLDAVEVSHETLKAICSAVSIPVVAIGGISEQNIQELSGTGFHGVALVSAIFGAKDITAACKRLFSLSKKAVEAC